MSLVLCDHQEHQTSNLDQITLSFEFYALLVLIIVTMALLTVSHARTM